MKPKVAIGITTYLDISPPEFGERLFDAYCSVSSKIAPNKVYVQSQSYDVSNASDFSDLWALKAESRMYEDRRKEKLLEKKDFLVNCEWKHVGTPAGGGRAFFRPLDDQSRTNSILLDHNFASRIDWQSLFEKLVEIFQPSYAMLHLFTDQENASLGMQPDRFENFDRAFGGEEHFTSWKTASGDWRKPDKWQLDERRQYRHLPELSWGNFLGIEFAGQYDHEFLGSHAVNVRSEGEGLYFETTADFSDVANKYEHYSRSRRVLKSAFKPDFFRRKETSN